MDELTEAAWTAANAIIEALHIESPFSETRVATAITLAIMRGRIDALENLRDCGHDSLTLFGKILCKIHIEQIHEDIAELKRR